MLFEEPSCKNKQQELGECSVKELYCRNTLLDNYTAETLCEEEKLNISVFRKNV
jgi:hypothetical protein